MLNRIIWIPEKKIIIHNNVVKPLNGELPDMRLIMAIIPIVRDTKIEIIPIELRLLISIGEESIKAVNK
jgi:hypothetical protein